MATSVRRVLVLRSALDQSRLIKDTLATPRVIFIVLAALLSAHPPIEVAWTMERPTPYGMITAQSNQLVLEADRVLFSRKVPRGACSLTGVL
jgi:hypothetical protein